MRYEPIADRVRYVSELTAAWAALRDTAAADRRIALVLANYPNRDGRLGNGVGLDTPAGAVELFGALKKAGYSITDIPAGGDAGLIDAIGVCGATILSRPGCDTFSSYRAFWRFGVLAF